MSDIRKRLCDNGYEDVILFDNLDYDDAIIGITRDERVVYDYDLMVDQLMRDQKINQQCAADWIDHNVLSTCYSLNDPIVMFRILK